MYTGKIEEKKKEKKKRSLNECPSCCKNLIKIHITKVDDERKETSGGEREDRTRKSLHEMEKSCRTGVIPDRRGEI